MTKFASSSLPPRFRSQRSAAHAPRRIVVELRPSEYAELEAACGPFCSPAQYVRLVALRLAELDEHDADF